MKWGPTEDLVHAVLHTSFTPLQRNPELVYTSPYYMDVYLGSEVYIFARTTDKKWVRCYFCSRPMPEDYISSTTNGIGQKQLPDVTSKVVILPMKCLTILPDQTDIKSTDEINFFKRPEEADFQGILGDKVQSPSLFKVLNKRNHHHHDHNQKPHLPTTASNSQSTTGSSKSSFSNDGSATTGSSSVGGDTLTSSIHGETAILNTQRPSRPPFPYFRYQNRPIEDEVGVLLSVLCSHIYMMYSSGEYVIYNKLTQLYQDIDELRFKLKYNLTTQNEKQRVIERTCNLLAQISKYLSTKGRTNKLSLSSSGSSSLIMDDKTQNISCENGLISGMSNYHLMTRDPYGYEGIFARDLNTGQLLRFKDSSLKGIVTESLVYGLTNVTRNSSLPVTSRDSDANLVDAGSRETFFNQYLTTNVLMDFQNIISDPTINDPKLDKIIMSVYLITGQQENLTEPFHIDLRNINHQSHQYSNNLILDTLSTVTFPDLPRSIINDQQVYLVIILREEIKIAFKSNVTADSFKAPFILIDDSTVDNRIHKIKRGVSIGVTDISSIFHKDILLNSHNHIQNGNNQVNNNNNYFNMDKSFKFKVNLYTSVLEDDDDNTNTGTDNNTSHSNSDNSLTSSIKPSHLNLGWGSIIPNILNDSTSGVIVNPRAISINVVMKEFIPTAENKEMSSLLINSTQTYGNINLNPTMEKMYLKMGKVSLSGVTKRVTNIKNIAIKVVPTNHTLRFNKNSNETKLNSWVFTSVPPGESMNETTSITNLDNLQTDSLRVLAYLNGYLMAQGTLPISRDGKIIEYPKGKLLQLISSQGNAIIDLEVTTTYFGHRFNTPSILRDLERLLSIEDMDPERFKSKCLKVLKTMERISVNKIIRYFDDIVVCLLRLIEDVNNRGLWIDDETNLPMKIIMACVKYFQLTLHDTNRECREKFLVFYQNYSELTDTLPQVGKLIVEESVKLFSDKHLIESNDINQFCFETKYLFMLSLVSYDNKEEWYEEFDKLMQEVSIFIKLTHSELLAGQNSLLEGLNSWINGLDSHITDDRIMKYTELIFQGFRERELLQEYNGDNLTDEEIKYLNTKFVMLQHVINHKKLQYRFFKQKNVDPRASRFLKNTIDWVLRSSLILGKGNPSIITLRLSNSVLITIFERVKDRKIKRNLLRLLPTCCSFFIHIKKYCRENGLLKPKRVFNPLFPSTADPIVIPIDSIINDEVIVEELLEIATIICQLAKIASELYGTNPSFYTILDECKYDKEFDSIFFITKMKKEYAFTITKTVKIFINADFFSSKKLLGIIAMLARCSIKLLTLCKNFIAEECSDIESVTPDAEINKRLWVYYLKCLLKVSNHKIAALLQLAIIPRKAVYAITGDLKKQIAYLLESAWQCLSHDSYDEKLDIECGVGHVSKSQYDLIVNNPVILKEMLVSSFHNHIDSTKICGKIIWGLVVSCWKYNESLQPLLNIVIPELYNAYAEGKLSIDDEELDKYTRSVMFVVHISKEHPLFKLNLEFFQELLGFLQIISELCKLPEQQEFDGDRVSRYIEMFGYLLDADRPELFHKLINDIFIHSIKKSDYVQAGLSLELLAKTYSWDPSDYLPGIKFPPLPEQSSFERKEYLYKEAARNFSRGMKLEKALSIYKDLIKAYDEINYDLNGLAFVHDQISQIYTEMQNVDRLVPTYFKVSFMGFGFPLALRNKIFIFEGLPFEHISSMQNRLLKVYHGSTMINSQEETDFLLSKTKMGKFINVVTVEPQLSLSEEYANRTKNSLMNNRIRLYIENRDLRTFRNSRRLPGSKSMTDLWVEEYTYTTLDTFPTLTNRSTVTNIQKRNLSPIENATRTLQTKIQDLVALENLCYKVLKDQEDSSNVFKELSRNLTGTISAPVNGGISEYKEFFQDPMCKDFDPIDIEKLRMLFDDLTIELSHCLALHSKMLPEDHPLDNHQILTELFKENFAEELERNDIDLDNMTVEDILRFKNNNTQTSHRDVSSRNMLKKNYTTRDPFRLHSTGSSFTGNLPSTPRTANSSVKQRRPGSLASSKLTDGLSSTSLMFRVQADSLMNNFLKTEQEVSPDASFNNSFSSGKRPSLSGRSWHPHSSHSSFS